MKKLSIVAVIIVAAVAFTSCASSGKYFSNAVNVNGGQTQVVLSQANYKVVKDVSTVVKFTQKFKFNSKHGKIYFGELTFYDASGFEQFIPQEKELELGSWITLPKRFVKK